MNTLKRIVRKEGKTVEIKDVKNKAGQSYKEFYEDMLEANAELQKRIAELEADKVSLTKDLAEKQEQLDQTAHKCLELEAEANHQRENKNQAYRERNMLVACLARIFPSGIAKTNIEGWNPEWHNCVYIDAPFGQCSWHYHDSQADLFDHLLPYKGAWDGHTTDDKYRRLMEWAKPEPPKEQAK